MKWEWRDFGINDPADQDPERQVLGCLLISPEHRNDIRTSLSTASFSDPTHQLVFDAIVKLMDQGSSVSILSVADQLAERSELTRSDALVRLRSLCRVVTNTEHLAYYLNVLKCR